MLQVFYPLQITNFPSNPYLYWLTHFFRCGNVAAIMNVGTDLKSEFITFEAEDDDKRKKPPKVPLPYFLWYHTTKRVFPSYRLHFQYSPKEISSRLFLWLSSV